MLVSVIACIGATFAALGWIGWRYFVPSATVLQAGARTADAAEEAACTPQGIGAPFGGRRQHLSIAASRSLGPLLVAIILIVLTAATVLSLSGKIVLDPLRAADLVRQQHIQAALNPETLVPPPPLPPSTFLGTGRPGLETANRDWSLLNPNFSAVVLRVFARLEARGYPFTLLEGYRSPDRQDVLAAAGSHVTSARAFQSKHQYGLAVDVAPLRNGRLVISERDPWAMEAYLALGEEAESAGLLWGGRWRLKDYGHVEAAGLAGRDGARN